MDELRFNKVFAGFLCAGLLIMAGVQLAHFLLPDQQLAENSYVIEVPEATEVADAAPQDTGPEPILALLASACLLYTSPSPRDATLSRMPSSA